MHKEQILQIIERMRKEGQIKDVCLSAYINMKMKIDEIDQIYELLEKDNLLIILRSVSKQYSKLINECVEDKEGKLKLQEFDKILKEKGLENEVITKLFKAAMEKNEYGVFTKACDLLYKYN